FAASLLAVVLFGSRPAATQEAAAGKQLCPGCSVDGKATPRTANGHPDFSGYWGGGNVPPPGAAPAGAAAGGRGPGGAAFQRLSDGSILFDFGTEYNEENGIGRICPPLDKTCQVPNQPPYNDKYMAKVNQIAKTEFGGTTALDPNQDCR